MDLVRFLHAVRRRWPVVVVTIAVAIGVAEATAATVPPPSALAPSGYRATAILLDRGTERLGFRALGTIGVLATTPEVAELAASALEFRGDPMKLAGTISAMPNGKFGIIRLSATASTPARAVTVAQAWTTALLERVATIRGDRAENRAHVLRRAIGALKGVPGSRARLVDLRAELAATLASLSTAPGLQVVQAPVAERLEPPARLVPPPSGASRIAVAALIGLLVAVGAILVSERFDTRLRTSREVAEASDLPVLAAVPVLPGRGRARISVADDPLSEAANAFRMLAASVASRVRAVASPAPSHGFSVLVASAEPSEGRTTIVVNLAAIFAERGSRVLAMSADLRHPDLHERFGVDDVPGLVQFAADAQHRHLGSIVTSAWEPPVLVVPGGGTHDRPAEIVASDRIRVAIAQATELADVVIVDSPAVMTAADAITLVPHVDAVLVVTRAGASRAADVTRLSSFLRMIGAPVVGVVVNAAREPDSASRPVGSVTVGASA